MRTKNLRCILAILGLTLLLQPREAGAQNLVELGSDRAPIRYIRGTGSNIGLIVGVEFNPGPAVGKTSRVHEMGVLHRRGAAFKAGGQGVGKAAARYPSPNHLETGHQNAELTGRLLRPLLALGQLNGETNKFQILPAARFALNRTGITEILLPLICHDLYLPVPDITNQDVFEVSPIPEAIMKAYLGIYRFDQHLNDNVIQSAWVNGNQITYLPRLSIAEANMITYCEIEVDSTTLHDYPPGFYDITHAHLLPALANFPIWVAAENQDQTTCEAGIHYLWRMNGYDQAPAEVVQAIFALNHLVFSFAEVDSFKSRFPEAGSPSPPAPNLRPYAFIQWYPDHAQQQNQHDGVKFSAGLSFDVDGQIMSYRWQFGDGATSTEANPTHKYLVSGSYLVTLTVEDEFGGQAMDSVLVEDLVTSVSRRNDLVPESFHLANVFPNPFAEKTTLSFSLANPDYLRLAVFDLMGREVRNLYTGRLDAGEHQIEWDGTDSAGRVMPAGVYYSRLSTSTRSHINKMILIR